MACLHRVGLYQRIMSTACLQINHRYDNSLIMLTLYQIILCACWHLLTFVNWDHLTANIDFRTLLFFFLVVNRNLPLRVQTWFFNCSVSLQSESCLLAYHIYNRLTSVLLCVHSSLLTANSVDLAVACDGLTGWTHEGSGYFTFQSM